MNANYDNIANYYDWLSSLVFGKTPMHAQICLLDAIPAGGQILIVGGGTGWILEAISDLHPSELKITYVDSSKKMIQFSQKRKAGNNEVKFITSKVEELQLSKQFDVIITPFFFDNFSDSSTRNIFSILDNSLNKTGIWLYCDFRNTNVFRHKMLLKIMYLFFRLFSGIEATRLPDIDTCFKESGYEIGRKAEFINGFVEAVVYKRIAAPGSPF